MVKTKYKTLIRTPPVMVKTRELNLLTNFCSNDTMTNYLVEFVVRL